MDEYEIVVPEENLNPQVDLSGYSGATWNDNREPVGVPAPEEVARAQDNSLDERGRGDVLGASSVWERTGANILNAVAQTGINVYAARNGVYSSQLPQNTQSNATPQQLRQTQQAKNQGLLMLAAVVGLVYALSK